MRGGLVRLCHIVMNKETMEGLLNQPATQVTIERHLPDGPMSEGFSTERTNESRFLNRTDQ
jgi:hypothetical protein